MSGQPHFPTASEAAHQLKEAARASGVQMHTLPYSRHHPQQTSWWLLPRAANPAYSLGKIVVDPLRQGKPLFVGYHVEKGIGPGAADVFRSSANGEHLIMDPQWRWHAFEAALRAREIDTLLSDHIAPHLDEGVVLGLRGGYMLPPDQRGHGLDVPWPYLEFTWNDGALTLEKRPPDPGILRPLVTSETLAGLARAIEAIDRSDYVWLDLWIGAYLQPQQDSLVWSPRTVWDRLGAPWIDWLG